jgi:gliding motility-associated-like protein
MRWLPIVLLLVIGEARGQQVIELCPDELNTFTYWATSNTAGTWVWTLNNDTISLDHQVTITWDSVGIFDIIVQFYNGCAYIPEDYIVYVLECLRTAMYFPNTFTPNGDGINDYWKPVGIGTDDLRWWIFDRWGLEIYKAEGFDDSWDGCMDYKGGRRPCQADVYIWLCQWKEVSGTEKKRVGRVTIAR